MAIEKFLSIITKSNNGGNLFLEVDRQLLQVDSTGCRKRCRNTLKRVPGSTCNKNAYKTSYTDEEELFSSDPFPEYDSWCSECSEPSSQRPVTSGNRLKGAVYIQNVPDCCLTVYYIVLLKNKK